MVDSVLMENAKRMLDSGIPKDEVISMLVSLGYTDAQAKEAVGSGKEQEKKEPKQNEESKFVVEENEPEDEKRYEKSKQYASHAELASTMAMNVVDNAAKRLDEHREHLNNLNDSLKRTNEKLESANLDKIDDVHSDVGEIKAGIADLAAKTNVTLDLMKKILENQRELIMKLK